MSSSETSKVVRHPSQDRILDEAEALFAGRGYTGVGLAELAERAGLSKSSLFHHFPSKIEIYASVLERAFERLWREIDTSAQEAGTPLERIERILGVWVDFMGRNPNTAPLLLRSLVERDYFEDIGYTRKERLEGYGKYMAKMVAVVVSNLKQGIADGAFRRQSAGQFIQTLIGAVLFHFASGEFGAEMIQGDLYDPEKVEQRKQALQDFVRGGLLKHE